MIFLLPLYIPYPYTLKGKREQKKSFSSALRRLVRLITPSSLALRPETKESLGKIFKKTPMDCEEPSPTLAFQHAVLL